MTPWCVVNGQTKEKRQAPAWGRLLLVGLVALLVAGTGIVLIPRDSGVPDDVSFTEAARRGALDSTLELRSSSLALQDAGSLPAPAAGSQGIVTLLTTHARALQSPATSRPSGTVSTGAVAPSKAAFVAGLSASGHQRLRDAREADGGIARLLAAVGTSQLLAAEELATAWQLPAPGPVPDQGGSTTAAGPVSCPSVSPTSEPGSATTDAALAAAVRSGQEAVYVYQVALKRIEAGSADSAAAALAAHEQLLHQAETLTRANCGDVPAPEAGYRLPAQFAQSPAAALGALEAASLPRFGDLVALSTGGTRDWAISGLLATGRRSALWGAPLPPLPGLTLDAGNLPPLPTPSDSNAG